MAESTTASTEEILSAVERWARAAGHWHPVSDFDVPWCFSKADGQIYISVPGFEKRPDPASLLLFALAIDADIAVDLGQCRFCGGEGTRTSSALHSQEEADAWIRTNRDERPFTPSQEFTSKAEDDGIRFTLVWSCCKGSGRNIEKAARLVFDASPQHVSWPKPSVEPGDRQAIENLCVLADKLLEGQREFNADHEKFGRAVMHWLSFWQAGDLQESREAVDTLIAAWERLTVRVKSVKGPGG